MESFADFVNGQCVIYIVHGCQLCVMCGMHRK